MNSDDWDGGGASSASSSNDGPGSIDLSKLKAGHRPISGLAYKLIQRLDDGSGGFGTLSPSSFARTRSRRRGF